MIAQANVTHMLVGKDADVAAITDTRATLDAGQIGVFIVGSTTATGANVLTAGDRYTIVLKTTAGDIIETPVLTYGQETSKESDAYVAPAQKITAIGFNGTTGTIDVSNSTNYVMHIFWKDNSKLFGGHGQPVKFAAYYSDAASSQLEIATGLVNNFNKNFSRENPKLIKAEVLINSAGTAVPTGAGTIDFVNGSKYVKFNTDITDATGTAVLAVGDYLKVATGTTTPAYKVTAIDATNDIATLDTPYQGATSLATANATAKIVLAATAAAAATGVRLTALANTDNFEAGVVRYEVIDFDVELKEEFGSTDYTVLTTPTTGSGSYWEVAENEWFLKGNRGETWRVGRYPKTVTLEATSGKTYNYVSLTYFTNQSKTLDRRVEAFGNILIATEVASAGAINANLQTILGI